MVVFESKIKKILRLSKYVLFVFVGTMLSFISFHKGESGTILSGLSVDPMVAHADVPITSGDAGSVGSDGPGDDDAGAGAGSCCSSCSDDGSL